MTDTRQTAIFDRALLRDRRARMAANFGDHSILFDEAGECLIERLRDVKRDFKSILNLGARHAWFPKSGSGDNKTHIVSTSLSPETLSGFEASVVADEEFLPFAQESFDLIISNLALHWVNDLPGTLAQIKYSLRPDGLFLAALLGGHTLHELRNCLLDAELAETGGVSPRTSPMIDLQTASALLQRAGFLLPVTDQETITLTYSDAFALMRDVRGMGEGGAHLQRLRVPTRRAVFHKAADLYQSRFRTADGTIPASFDILFLHGWKNSVA